MGKCVRCGISGAFVKVDDRGLCVICRNKVQKSPQKPSSPAIVLNSEEVITRYVSTYHNTYPSDYNVVDYYLAEFNCMLDSLPTAEIQTVPCDPPRGDAECVILKKFDGYSLSDLSDFVAVDTETSGIGTSAEIVEVSAVRFENFRPVQIFETLCKPYRRISPQATAIHGITDEMVKHSPRFSEIIPALDDFSDGLPLVAHNAPFDMRMLAGEGFPTAGRRVFDTLPIARTLLRDKNGDKLPSYKLAEACKQCAILFSGAHRSSADALADGLLFLELVKRRFGVESLLQEPTLWKN